MIGKKHPFSQEKGLNSFHPPFYQGWWWLGKNFIPFHKRKSEIHFNHPLSRGLAVGKKNISFHKRKAGKTSSLQRVLLEEGFHSISQVPVLVVVGVLGDVVNPNAPPVAVIHSLLAVIKEGVDLVVHHPLPLSCAAPPNPFHKSSPGCCWWWHPFHKGSLCFEWAPPSASASFFQQLVALDRVRFGSFFILPGLPGPADTATSSRPALAVSCHTLLPRVWYKQTAQTSKCNTHVFSEAAKRRR